jgi:hypothetical protein
MTDYNGGYQNFANRTRTKTFFRAADRNTKTITVKSGQVIKAYSFLESDVNGKMIAHGGLVESATVVFGASITTGQTVILAGLTFTAGSGSVTAIQLADIWSGLTVGDTAAVASAIILAKGYSATVVGTFTSGTLAGYSTTNVNTTKVRFDAVGTGAASATDVAISGTGAAAGTVAITQYAALNKVAGVLAFDVDATSADVDASAYTEASFWADALVWAVDTAVDTVTKFDGTTVAVTAYNTGCAGTSAASNLLKQKFVEGTEFEELGFLSAGETL